MGGGLVLVLVGMRPVGLREPRPPDMPPGQVQGPLIHPTPPLVPTGCRTHLPPFGWQSPSGGWGRKCPDHYLIRSSKIIRTRGPLAALSFPNLVVKVHQLSGRLVRSRYVLLASPRTKRCITSSHKSSSRSFPWRISGCSGLCRI